MSKAASAERQERTAGAIRVSRGAESPEAQITILTDRITSLAEHFKTHAKDNHSRRGLLMLVNKRRSLLEYLRKEDSDRYLALINKLGLRSGRSMVGFRSRNLTEREPEEDAPSVAESSFQPDLRAQSILRGVEIAEGDLKTAGGTFDLAQVRTLLGGISRQAIDKRTREGSLFAVPGPSNRRRYPTIQFSPDGRLVGGMKEVINALPTQNPWAILNFLVQPDSRLNNRTPISLLKVGKVAKVVDAARRLGRQGG